MIPYIESLQKFLGTTPWAKGLNEATKALTGKQRAYVAMCLWDTFYLGWYSSLAGELIQNKPPVVLEHDIRTCLHCQTVGLVDKPCPSCGRL